MVDNKFETFHQAYAQSPPKTKWQMKCHFQQDNTTKPVPEIPTRQTLQQ
jgi:hypothetical protein